MLRKLFASTLMLILISACGGTTQPPKEEPTNMNEPVNNATPLEPSSSGSYVPSPADSNLVRGKVFLDKAALQTLESFPPQFVLALKGNLPTPCNQLRVAVTLPDAENKINVDVYSVVGADEICTQVLQPFEVNFPLGSFPSGKYSLWINGSMAAEFQS